MTRYITRRLLTLVGTMLVISILVFLIVEVAPGNVARNILGPLSTPEQQESMQNQLGLDRPVHIRYISWLIGCDWMVRDLIEMPVQQTVSQSGTVEQYRQWWALDEDGSLVQWDVMDGDLYKLVRQKDGSTVQVLDNDAWRVNEEGVEQFWGLDNRNRAALWRRGQEGLEYSLTYTGWLQSQDSPVDYVPLSKGILRGDAGTSMMLHRPVSEILGRKLQNSAILAALAFAIAMPIAIVLGLVAGLNQGKFIDRIISVGGLMTTASPDFATGIVLILILAVWLSLLPGATVFLTKDAVLGNPKMLIMPILTASLVEIGYVLRITRASVVDVMNSNYVRTAVLKGLSPRRIVVRHVLRNALMAPVTVIMLHVNWLIGGLVVVENVFGYPGLGNFILNAALYKDIYSIEAASMVMIIFAVGTQLVADIFYAFLNPRIRYT